MAKVKSDGKIWGLEFNQYVCFLFHVNGTILGWDIANCIFDLEIQGQGHNENWPKSKQVIYRPGPSILSKMKGNKILRPEADVAAYELVQKHSRTWYTEVT